MNAFFIPILIIGFLIFANGLFVAAEFAIVVAPYSRIARWAEEGKGGAIRVLPWLKEPAKRNRYIGTAQIGITIASLGLGMYGEETITHWLTYPLEHYLNLDAGAAVDHLRQQVVGGAVEILDRHFGGAGRKKGPDNGVHIFGQGRAGFGPGACKKRRGAVAAAAAAALDVG